MPSATEMQKFSPAEHSISLHSSTISTVNIRGSGYCRIFAMLECEVGTSCLRLDN